MTMKPKNQNTGELKKQVGNFMPPARVASQRKDENHLPDRRAFCFRGFLMPWWTQPFLRGLLFFVCQGVFNGGF
ncbi:MAG: hypothetical protein PHQ22_10315 [Sulfuricurvum sp.]|nr:hypothetical protein [Sulfuricurvum sp.]